MKYETLKYLETLLTEKVISGVGEVSPYAFPHQSEPFQDLMKAHTALKEVCSAIRRAETRAVRKAGED